MPFVTAAVAAEEGAPHKRDKTLEIVLAKQRGKGSDNGLCSGALRREADADWQTSA